MDYFLWHIYNAFVSFFQGLKLQPQFIATEWKKKRTKISFNHMVEKKSWFYLNIMSK